ncbi:hypothetical protein [Actinoplanes sp. NPDC020271]|uniref:hypothetical protein n=1 Tax=Actinoplanes sp. NPDC020271 TaxID=3363896 RepID=UPI0037B6C337
MNDLAAAALAALTPYLPLTLPGSPAEIAADVLQQLIEKAFAEIGAEPLWAAYARHPSNPAAVEPMLAAALHANPALAAQIEGAVRTVEDNSTNQTDLSNISANGPVAGRDNAIDSHNTTGSHNTQNRNSHNSKTSLGGPIAILAVVIVALVAIFFVGRAVLGKITDSLTLDKDSSCSKFLDAGQEQELTAMRKVGVELGVRGIGSPLALPAITYECSGHPDETLGQAIAKYKNSF